MAHNKRFNEVAIKYNLHIEHINFARQEFENHAADFIGSLETNIDDYFSNEIGDKKVLEARYPTVKNNTRHTSLTNFRHKLDFMIYSIKKGNSRFWHSGTFSTCVYFDNDQNIFTWSAWFNNKNYLDSNIDEEIKKIIDNGDYQFLKTAAHHKDDDICFFNIPIDDSFPERFEDYLKESVEVLCKAFLASPYIMTEEEAQVTNIEDSQSDAA